MLGGHHAMVRTTTLRDRDRPDYNGHPERKGEDIRWAHNHDFPDFDDEVRFPDLPCE